jgi:hypothetical protein
MGQKQTTFHCWSYEPDALDIVGTFLPNNTSNPVATSNIGDRSGGLWIVTRTAAGTFLVTFADTYYRFLAADANLIKPAGSLFSAEVIGYNPTNVTVNSIAPATLQVRVSNNTTGTATDVGPTAGLGVNFWCRVGGNNLGGR